MVPALTELRWGCVAIWHLLKGAFLSTLLHLYFLLLFSKKNAWQSHFTQSLFCWVEHGRNMTEGAPTGALHQCGLQGSLCLCFAALHQDLWVQLPGRVRGVLLTFRHNLYISLKKESMR